MKKNDLIKIIVLFMLMIIGMYDADAQVTREGNTFVAEQTSSSSSNTKTEYTYVDTDGKEYPVYISKNGRCFIYRVSKKTNKPYKKYLPEEVSRTICEELGREYKE